MESRNELVNGGKQTADKDKISEIAKKIMDLSSNILLTSMKFMSIALVNLEVKESWEVESMTTSGKKLYYNPLYVVESYKEETRNITRDYMHMLLHYIFRHMYSSKEVDDILWDISCDIAAENTISEWELDIFKSPNEQEQESKLSSLRQKIKIMTAEKIYAYMKAVPMSKNTLREYFILFSADIHRWYISKSDVEKGSGKRKNGGSQSNGGSAPKRENQSGNDDSDDENDVMENLEKRKRRWEEISEKIQQDLETFSKEFGNKAGNLIQNLAEVNREVYDYTEFLKKFAVMKEAIKINDDEFDYIFYTYGLQIYGKVPLIEPLEYKEVNRIKEFVIAIDTSGSVSGELVQTFVKKTYNILKSTESFFSKINVHIIQCDSEIQQDAKITNQREFDEYLKHMKIKGLGGTDFRPVFSYVDKMIQDKEFRDLRGLIYFTDGYGLFPKKMPEYQTAFIFIDEGYNNYKVPPWAIKIILKKDEL